MTDPRIAQLAKNIISYATELKKGENILIEAFGPSKELAAALVREAYNAGGYPYLWLRDPAMQRELLMNASDQQLEAMAEVDSLLMEKMQCYVGVRASENITEMSDVPADRLESYARLYSKPVHSVRRVKNTRWVVMRYPNPSMAQLASMSTAAFEDFYFNVCNLDYNKMSKAMDALVNRMEKTDKVRLVSPGTDLTFSIKGLPAIKCDGKLNIPDGEVFTAPVKESVNGVITFNTPSVHNGVTFERVKLTFKDGKIINAEANYTEKLNKILDTDEGARFIGEFALGVNPYILNPMKDTLFDEKIAGSFHFTPGSSYDECDNGNKSAIHWDMVLIQTPEYGGGEIYFDDKLIRMDGLFVSDDLMCLNPDKLK